MKQNLCTVVKLGCLFVCCLALACGGTDDETQPMADEDAEVDEVAEVEEWTEEDADMDAVENTEELEDEGEEEETDERWRAVLAQGDASGDCADEDDACAADLLSLDYHVAEGVLYWRVRLADGLPSGGSFELFFLAPDTSIVGHTLRISNNQMSYWNADCSSARKHAGCHWTSAAKPSSLQYSKGADGLLYVEFKLADLGYESLETLLAGIAAAPFAITKTAEFTDRLPDALWVTATEVQGLAEISLDEDDTMER